MLYLVPAQSLGIGALKVSIVSAARVVRTGSPERPLLKTSKELFKKLKRKQTEPKKKPEEFGGRHLDRVNLDNVNTEIVLKLSVWEGSTVGIIVHCVSHEGGTEEGPKGNKALGIYVCR